MGNRKVPELFVEQVLLGEASPTRKAEVEAEIGAAVLTERLEAIKESDAEILRRYPPGTMADRIRGRLEAETAAASRRAGLKVLSGGRRLSGGARGGIFASVAVAAAVTLAVIYLPGAFESRGSGAAGIAEVTRAKGTPEMLIYREGVRGAELLRDRASVKSGDVLQIKYVPSGRPFGAIVSIDGRGAVTLHYPESSGGSTRLDGDRASALSYAYQLDDAPSFERFFFVTSRREFPASVVVSSAERLAKSGGRAGVLDLPNDFEQTSELLLKGE